MPFLQAGQIANFDIKATETFSSAVYQVCICYLLYIKVIFTFCIIYRYVKPESARLFDN